jgi:hypothetical protein
MAKWIGAAILTFTLMFAGPAAIECAIAAPSQAAEQKPPDLTARRHTRLHRHYAYRRYDQPYYPTYYDRPYYYAPAPFFPFFGLGYGPWW